MTAHSLVAMISLVLLVGACGSSPEPLYYALGSRGGTARESPQRVVLVRHPVIAGYLDRESIVRGVDSHRLQIASGDRWASPLGDMIGRVLIEDLAARLPGSTVVSEPLETTDPDVRVNLDVHRFEGGEDGTVTLQANVVVELGRSHPALRSRVVVLEARPPGPSTGALVDTMSSLLSRLADAIVDLMAA